MRAFYAILMLMLLAYAVRQTEPAAPFNVRVVTSREMKVREEQPGARIAWESARRLPAGAQHIDPAWLAEANTKIQGMPTLRAKRAHEWQWLGPTQLGGRTRAIAFSPKPPHTMFVGAASGGLFKSNDQGRTFEFSGKGLVHLSIGAIALHADGRGILVGTGELYRNTEHPYSAMSGGGVFESLDGGANFSPWRSTLNSNFAYVSDLVISPRNPKRVYIASNSGVWRSNDGGRTVEQLLWPATADMARYEGCTDLDLYLEDAKEQLLVSCASRSTSDRYYLPGTVFGTACVGPCPSALFRTNDASASNVVFEQVLSEAGMGRSSIARAPSNPKILYLLSASIAPGPDRDGDLVGDYNNGLHALFRSNDGGLSWQAQLRNISDDPLSTFLLHNLTGPFNTECLFFSGGNDYYAAGWYDQAIAVDPKSPDTVWVGGIDLFRSDDGGRSFGVSSYWWKNPGEPGAVHGDNHVLIFDPNYDGITNRRLFIGNDGGVASTEDTQAPTNRGPRAACEANPATAKYSSSLTGLGSSQFYHGTVSPDAARIVAGAQDNGTWLQQVNGNGLPTESRRVFGGDGSYSAIDPRDPLTFYVSSQYGNVYRLRQDPFGAINYTRIGQGVPEAGMFITPFVLDAANPDLLWLGTNRVWRSSNRGTTWERASASFGTDFGDLVNAIATHKARPGTVVVGSARGIFRNTSAYASTISTVWQGVQPRSGWVSSLAFDPSDAQTLYATYSTFGGSHVWRSRDGGLSFSAIDNNLPNLPAHSIAVHPSNSNMLYLGTDLGLFVSSNGGESWTAEESGFGQAIIESLVINSQAPHFLHAFTYGRGIWRIPLGQIDAASVDAADPQFTGHWWNPTQSGQGLHMEVLNQNDEPRLLVSWYTYKNGKPHWLYGVGPLKNQRASVALVALSGADFPPRFQTSQVQQTPFGTVEIEFQTPQLARLTYPGGTLDLEPLTRPSFAAPRAATQLSECHSGNWYQPENSGHGLSVLVHPGGGGAEAIITWYVYLKGEGFYLVGNGPIENGVATMAAYRTEGAQFGPEFRTSDVRVTRVGEMRFSAISANQTRFEWVLDPSVMPFDPAHAEQQRSGNLVMTRLTTVAGLNCDS